MRNAIVLLVLLTLGIFPSVALAQTYVANIDGNQPVPPTLSPGTGLGCFSLGLSKILTYEVAFGGLLGVETAAHIHGPATIGVNAAVIFPFALGTPKNGTFGPLTALEELYLNSGQLYVNIHSNLFPGGEIRGQILPNPIACTVPVEDLTWGAIKALYETQ